MKEFIEKLIGRLEEEREKSFSEYCEALELYREEFWRGRMGGFTNAISIVNELAEEYNGGWIPCSSGNMPNKDGMYLTTVFDKSTNRRMLRQRKFENGRFIEGGTSRAFPVVAWYYEPLPEPYKGE